MVSRLESDYIVRVEFDRRRLQALTNSRAVVWTSEQGRRDLTGVETSARPSGRRSPVEARGQSLASYRPPDKLNLCLSLGFYVDDKLTEKTDFFPAGNRDDLE